MLNGVPIYYRASLENPIYQHVRVIPLPRSQFSSPNFHRPAKPPAKLMKKSLMAAASLLGMGLGAGGTVGAHARDLTMTGAATMDDAVYRDFNDLSAFIHKPTSTQGSVPFVAMNANKAFGADASEFGDNEPVQGIWPRNEETAGMTKTLRFWHVGAFLSGGLIALVRIFGANRVLNFLAAAAPGAARAAKVAMDAPVKAARAVANSAASWGRLVLSVSVLGVFALAGLGYYNVEWLGGLAVGGALTALVGYGGSVIKRGLALSPIRVRTNNR